MSNISDNPFLDRKDLVKKATYVDSLIEQIKSIDVEKSDFSTGVEVGSSVVEEQRVYFWIRLYLHDEIDILPDTDITITYVDSGEKLETKFICYAKKGHIQDMDETVINYNPEDDKKVLCLMIDADRINKKSDDIPFIRTLFRIGRYYRPQVLRLSDLSIVDSKGNQLYCYDIDF